MQTFDDFHNALCEDVGKSTEAYSERRVGKVVLRVPSAAHRTAWCESTINLQAAQIRVNVFFNFEQNDLSQEEYVWLRTLACTGIARYWSGGLAVGKQRFAVTVTAHHREQHAIKVDLYVSNDKSYARSHNVGILSIDASFKYNKGWFGSKADADLDFMMTSAHEFGHSVLIDFGGVGLSWGHKGSTNPILQSVKSSTPGYPTSGGIDLMKYYDDDKNGYPGLTALAARSKASALDLKRLIWLSKIIS